MLCHKWQPETLSDCRQQQHYLHHRKIVSNTTPGSASAWEVGILWQPAHERFGPALRLKCVRFREKTRISVRRPRKHENLRARTNRVAADLAVIDRLPANSVGGWIKAHCFFRDHLSVFQVWKVTNCWQPSAQNAIQFLVEPGLALWIVGQQVPGPRKSQRG